MIFFQCHIKLVVDYAANVNNDQPGRWKEHGVEVVHGFFPCPPQALPPQVPPRPPERSFHNYGTSPNNLKPNYGLPSSSVTLGRYIAVSIFDLVHH